MRLLAVLALVPLLLLSPFTGRTLVPHVHEGHGTHFHAVETGERAFAAIQVKQDCPVVRQCHEAHRHTPSPAPDDDPDGVTVPSFEPVRGRGLEVAWGLGSRPYWPAVSGVILREPRAWRSGILGSQATAGLPPGMRLWSARERLVRTSQALLI